MRRGRFCDGLVALAIADFNQSLHRRHMLACFDGLFPASNSFFLCFYMHLCASSMTPPFKCEAREGTVISLELEDKR